MCREYCLPAGLPARRPATALYAVHRHPGRHLLLHCARPAGPAASSRSPSACRSSTPSGSAARRHHRRTHRPARPRLLPAAARRAGGALGGQRLAVGAGALPPAAALPPGTFPGVDTTDVYAFLDKHAAEGKPACEQHVVRLLRSRVSRFAFSDPVNALRCNRCSAYRSAVVRNHRRGETVLPEVARAGAPPQSAAGDRPGTSSSGPRARRISVVLPARDEEETVGRSSPRSSRDLMGACRSSTNSWSSTPAPSTRPPYAPRGPGRGCSPRTRSCPISTAGRQGRGTLEVPRRDLRRPAGLRRRRPAGVPHVLRDRADRPAAHRPGGGLRQGLLRPAPRNVPSGGGRVTELVARPLLNLHWPRLAGFVQPLAGEYAGRRSCWSASRSSPATAWSSPC